MSKGGRGEFNLFNLQHYRGVKEMKKDFQSYYQILVEKKRERDSVQRLRQEFLPKPKQPFKKSKGNKNKPRRFQKERTNLRKEFFERFEHYISKESE